MVKIGKTPRAWSVRVLIAACLALSLATSACSGNAESSAPSGSMQVERAFKKDSTRSKKQSAAELDDLSVEFIDVGQGDSELLELPDGKVMLIDAGDVSAGQTVVDALEDADVDTIDYLIATHPHADHIGGMPAVFDAVEVENVWLPDASTNTDAYERFLDAVDDEGSKVHEAKAGAEVVAGTAGYSVDVLAPKSDVRSDDLNDYSAIVRVTYGKTAMLFTGDASAQEIIDCDAGPVDVLKVAHHGSETGTTAAVLKALKPACAVISCAEGNDYGHPDQSVLDALAQEGVTVFCTAANGDVAVTSNGKTVQSKPGKSGEVIPGVSAAEREARAQAEREAKARAEAEHMAQEQAATQRRAEEEARAQREAQGQWQENQGATVYITNTGSKYHRDGCRYLRKSSIAIAKADAASQGSEPCSVCKP